VKVPREVIISDLLGHRRTGSGLTILFPEEGEESHLKNSKDSKESKSLSGIVRQAHGHGSIQTFFNFWFLVVYGNA
jgi:hypothetical protein